MFHLLTLATRILLSPYKITDKASCRTFLLRFISLVKERAAETETKIDDAFLKLVEFIVRSDALFGYVYCVISEQLQTEEILFESAEEEIVIELVEDAVKNTESPEAIDPVVIVSLITQIVSFINIVKERQGRWQGRDGRQQTADGGRLSTANR